MVKPKVRAYMRYTQEAAELLGQLIRLNRIERKMTTSELAERAGISRALLYRIETGDLSCSIGTVFEAAAIVGVPLFQLEPGQVTMSVANVRDRLTLMPKWVRRKEKVVKDDF